MPGANLIDEATDEQTGTTMRSQEPQDVSSRPVHAIDPKNQTGPRIALLTPYTGGNLGDAAIQDAVVANLRRHLPNARFSGITLNSRNFLEQHGTDAFPLVGVGIPFFGMDEPWSPNADDPTRPLIQNWRIRQMLRHVPAGEKIKHFILKTRSRFRAVHREASHWIDGYRFLHEHDLLLFSGGGQLDDNYGGPWGLPFSLLKWTLLSRLAGIPCAMASVGVGVINSNLSRKFLSVALRLSSYRSFREPRSRAAAAGMLDRANNDPVVADLALSLSDAELPASSHEMRAMAAGRPIIALSPMAFAKPVNWPAPDRTLHDRYVQQMAQILSRLSSQNYFIVVACSSRGDDESVIPDILGRLDEKTQQSLTKQIYFPRIASWRELVGVLRDADYLIASRLHGTIFGFLTQTPVVAISFASKVDWVLEYLQQSDYRLDIRNFTADDVLAVLDRIKSDRDAIVEKIASHRKKIFSDTSSGAQYALLSNMALEHYHLHR
jgi:polysaccharide pyruvyl transferase WcaK-like protein